MFYSNWPYLIKKNYFLVLKVAIVVATFFVLSMVSIIIKYILHIIIITPWM